jgi:hypothetical protein
LCGCTYADFGSDEGLILEEKVDAHDFDLEQEVEK